MLWLNNHTLSNRFVISCEGKLVEAVEKMRSRRLYLSPVPSDAEMPIVRTDAGTLSEESRQESYRDLTIGDMAVTIPMGRTVPWERSAKADTAFNLTCLGILPALISLLIPSVGIIGYFVAGLIEYLAFRYAVSANWLIAEHPGRYCNSHKTVCAQLLALSILIPCAIICCPVFFWLINKFMNFVTGR